MSERCGFGGSSVGRSEGDGRAVGLAAEGAVVVVVDLAPDRRLPASREPAVLVAGLEVPAHLLGNPVRVDREHRTGDGVGDEALPLGVPCREYTGGGWVDGGASYEVAGVVVVPRERVRGDDDLDAGADLPKGTCGGVLRVVERGCAREEEVGEEIRTDQPIPAPGWM